MVRCEEARGFMPVSFRSYVFFYFPSVQLTTRSISLLTGRNFGVFVTRIIPFVPRGSSESRTAKRQASAFNFRYSLTKRLELLRESRAGAAQMRTSQQYRARAEECRFEAEMFRDPKARAQMLDLAASYDCRAKQIEDFEVSG